MFLLKPDHAHLLSPMPEASRHDAPILAKVLVVHQVDMMTMTTWMAVGMIQAAGLGAVVDGLTGVGLLRHGPATDGM